MTFLLSRRARSRMRWVVRAVAAITVLGWLAVLVVAFKQAHP